MNKSLLSFALSLASLLGAASPAVAQPPAYPVKPITLVVGFPPGGISDVLSRALATRLSIQMGQSVVVDNKPGAGTTLASAYVAQAAPDGYTLYFQDMTTHAISAAAYKQIKFDASRDFSMISLVASTPLMLVSSLSSNAKDVRTLIAMLKAAPDKMAYASSGNGAITHLAAESFKQITGTQSLHVPYKGSAPALQAILGGEVAFGFSSMPPAISQTKAGKLNALAVTTAKRVPTAADVPTLKELGVPMELVLYSGLLGPKGMPAAVVDRLNAEVKKALESPEMKQVLVNAGADALPSSPAEFAGLMKGQMIDMAHAVKIANVTLD